MAAPLAPILALLAGGFLLTRSRGSKPKKSGYHCSPKGRFGAVGLAQGGLPWGAQQAVSKWMKTPAARAFQDAAREESKVYQTLLNESLDMDPGVYLDSMEAIRASAHRRVALAWQISDAYLEGTGCPIVPLGDDLHAIVRNGPQWMRWITAIGAFADLQDVFEAAPKTRQEDSLDAAAEFLAHHFLDTLKGQNPNEVAKYSELVQSLSVPIAGELQKYDAKIEAMTPSSATWMFNPLPLGKPFLVIEDRLNRLVKDYGHFLTGQDFEPSWDMFKNLKPLDTFMTPGALIGFAPRYIGLASPTTQEGAGFWHEYLSEMLRQRDPIPLPLPSRFETFPPAEDILRPVIARGELGPQWWDSGLMARIQMCFNEGLSLEDIAVSIIAGNNEVHGALCGIPLSDLEKEYPAYDRWWATHQGADYDDYTQALNAFKTQSPGIYLAIMNMMSMVAQKFPNQAAEFGFGGG